jgi:hypothetical protein
MDIHKPKPWHGVREFLKEYVIIVVGVLTALGAEQGVEWLHWRHQIELAHEALAFDMKRIMGWAGLQDALSPCFGARLDEIDKALDAAQATGRLPPLGKLPDHGRGSWVMRSWSMLTYGQILPHLPTSEQISLSALNVQVEVEHQNDQEFVNGWRTLSAIAGTGRPMDGAEITRLKEVVLNMRAKAASLRQGAIRSETFVIQSGVISRRVLEAAWRQGVENAKLNRPVCSPLPAFNAGDRDRSSVFLAQPMTAPGAAQMDDTGIRDEKLK